mgnify:CR=1 FL=1
MRGHDWNGIPTCFVCGRELTGWPAEDCTCLVDRKPVVPLVVQRWTTAVIVGLLLALAGVGVKVW